MRKEIAFAIGVAGTGIGLSAVTKWWSKNAPALSCQICRAFIWNVWPKHWGGKVEMRPGHGPHVIAA